jgi:hypothetical protein
MNYFKFRSALNNYFSFADYQYNIDSNFCELDQIFKLEGFKHAKHYTSFDRSYIKIFPKQFRAEIDITFYSENFIQIFLTITHKRRPIKKAFFHFHPYGNKLPILERKQITKLGRAIRGIKR